MKCSKTLKTVRNDLFLSKNVTFSTFLSLFKNSVSSLRYLIYDCKTVTLYNQILALLCVLQARIRSRNSCIFLCLFHYNLSLKIAAESRA